MDDDIVEEVIEEEVVEEEVVPDVELTEGTNYVTLAKHSNDRDAIRAIIEVTKDANNNRSRVIVRDIQFRSNYAGAGTWTADGYISVYTVYRYPGDEVVEEVTFAEFEYNSEWFQAANASTWVTLGYGKYAAFDVNHDSDGRKQIFIPIVASSRPYKFTTTGVNGSPTYSFTYTTIICQMPDIDRTVPTITASASANSSGSVTLTASANVSCGSWAYKIDNGDWNGLSGTGTSKSVTIPGMTGAHSFQVKASNIANGITGYSNTVSTTTPTLSLNKTAVATDSSLEVSVRYLPANVKVQAKYGSTVLKEDSWSSAKDSVTITYSASDLKAMFATAGVTTQQSITVTVQVAGYSYTAASFTLNAGSNMNPTVGTPTATIVQGSTVDSSLANVYIAGFSKVKVAAAVSAGSGSSISSVTLNYGSNSTAMSYNSSTGKYEATTGAPITGNTAFTVTATDARGLTGTNTVSVTGVNSWTEPVITFNTSDTYRCDSTGAKTEGGAFVRVRVSVAYNTSINNNGLRNLYFYIKEDGTSVTHNLTNGVQSAAYALGSPRPDSAITVVVAARDKVGDYVTRELQLSGAHQDFALANYSSASAGRRVTALGIGMAPDASVEAATYGDTIQLPAIGRLTIGGREAQNFLGVNTHREITNTTLWNQDLLTFDQTNPMAEVNETAEFYVPTSSISSWTNLPGAITSGNFEGTRMVLFGIDTVFIIVLEQTPVPGRIWINTKRKSSASTAWSGWKGHTPDIT